MATSRCYNQLADQLRAELAGRPVGSRFYVDQEICDRFEVTRPVARAAMQQLVEEGRVYRVRAKGTFVGNGISVGRSPATPHLAFVSMHAHHDITVKTLPGIQQMASMRGLDVIWRPNPTPLFDSAAMDALLQDLLPKVQGILWVTGRLEEICAAPPVLGDVGRRIVVINARLMRPDVTCVLPDNEAGMYNLCEHLIRLGRRQIGYVGGAAERPYARLRLEGYRKALAAHGLAPDPAFVRDYLPGDIPAQVGRVPEVVHDMLACGRHPDAFLAATEVGARGLLGVLKEKGLRVPEDIAVAAFGDVVSVEPNPPFLTIARQPFHELGWEAVRILLDQLDGKRAPGGVHLVPCPLEIHASSGTPP